MADVREYIQLLFRNKNVRIKDNRSTLFDDFAKEEENLQAVQQIWMLQKKLMEKWMIKSRVTDILQQHMTIPNGTVGRPYEAQIDYEKLGWADITEMEWQKLETIGLKYDPEKRTISGTPTQSGDTKLLFRFRLPGEAPETEWHEKNITFIVNPDPKSLWKDNPSDRTAPFYKEDAERVIAKLGEKTIVAASKRGRSHANVGAFRDDHFAFTHLDQAGWSIVAVSDGAGSARFSREGSRLACETVINYFKELSGSEKFKAFEAALVSHEAVPGEEGQKKLSGLVYDILSPAALAAHKNIEAAAVKAEASLKDFHSTLVYALFKKFPFGYVVLSFGVGDCPVALINKDLTELTLMVKLDVGEFSGGTRFITMPEIFTTESFSGRFRMKVLDDFAYLILMSDGIYDPKFGVEANLEQMEQWKRFLDDLAGQNADSANVSLAASNENAGEELLQWMDFWSPGNHDDRTLVIIF